MDHLRFEMTYTDTHVSHTKNMVFSLERIQEDILI